MARNSPTVSPKVQTQNHWRRDSISAAISGFMVVDHAPADEEESADGGSAEYGFEAASEAGGGEEGDYDRGGDEGSDQGEADHADFTPAHSGPRWDERREDGDDEESFAPPGHLDFVGWLGGLEVFEGGDLVYRGPRLT